MIKVKAKNGELADSLFKRFNRAFKSAGITNDMKKAARYQKPSEKRREQENRRQRNIQKFSRNGKGR